MRAEAFEVGTVARDGEKRRKKGRFWLSAVWALVPTVLVSLSIFRFDELPEVIGGFLFLGVMLPAVVICEKLGFGQFSIMGGGTLPDWVLYSVMIALVYLYSLGLVAAGWGAVRLALQAKRMLRGER
jgi:hypothetical protein